MVNVNGVQFIHDNNAVSGRERKRRREQTVFEIKMVDVNGVQFVHDNELVDTAELNHELTVDNWLDR